MPVSASFSTFIADTLAPVGLISIRRMFGGAGDYCDGLMFAILIDDTLYLKANATTRGNFQAEGMAPFIFQGRDKPVTMSYWR